MLLLSFANRTNPTMNPVRTKRLGLAALGLSLLTLLTVCILSYNDWLQFRKSSATIATIRRVVTLNQDLLVRMEDAETSQRGFLLTGEDRYLGPYQSAVRAAPAELDELTALTRGEAATAVRVGALRTLIGQKFEELRRTIELRKSKGLSAALEVVQTDFGLGVMERLRAVSAEIEADQEDKRQRSWDDLERQARIDRSLILAGALLLASFVAAGAFLMSRATRTQEALAAAAAATGDLLRTTLYSIGDAVITTGAQGAVRMMNPVAERLTGYSESEARGLPADQVFRIVNEETRAEVESPIRRVLREGQVVGLGNHTVLVSRTGQDVPIDDSGAPIRGRDGSLEGVVLVFRDVTERQQAQEALERSERRFRTLADSAPVMIWLDAPDGGRTFFNQPWLRFTGRSWERELGDGWKEGVHPEDARRRQEVYDRALETLQPFSVEFRLRRHDGRYCWVLGRGVPRFGEDGKFLGFTGSCTDIDDRKRAEEKMREAAKLESLGVLAGGIAHDFNNLLVGIMGNASLLEDYISDRPAALELVKSLQLASERAAKLTKQMLAYSGRGRFFVEPLDLSEQVRQIVGLIAASIPKNVEVRLALAERPPIIEADASQIQQVVMNLVINAAEAIGPEGGWVAVSTDARSVDEGTVADFGVGGTLAPGLYVELTVADNGSGMDAETQPRIFDPFFTTKFTGRGLGLAAVSGIVRGHCGAIKVESAPGKGASFQVYLPAAAAPAPRAEPGPPPEFSGTGKVLVVDDEEIVRRIARIALERAGYKVLLAADGSEAVETFRREADEIRLVALDMTMPGMSGEETLRRLREIRRRVPVVVSSGYTQAEVLQRFGDTIDGYLHKPYGIMDLARAVHAALKSNGQ
jgi:PAS domain S-box-containing protein